MQQFTSLFQQKNQHNNNNSSPKPEPWSEMPPLPKTKITSPVVLLGSPRANTIRRQRKRSNFILISIASTAICSSLVVTWYQMKALASLQWQGQQNVEGLTVEPPAPPPKPLRFISVVGPFHTGTKAMWQSIHNNEHVAAEKGIELKAYGTVNGGYPPCGVPLLSDSTVDMGSAMGNFSGVAEPNTHLFARYGTLWADWNEEGPYTLEGVLKMKPPHTQDAFYTWWKHTPPQHPILACHRPDTLYVVMVRHPKVWKQSMERILYNFKYEPLLKLWRLIRSNPRRLPPLELRFRSLYNAWEYWMKGYLSWERMSVGKNCYYGLDGNDSKNCLGGVNKMSDDKRNILIVRYEDYITSPKKVLAQIYSFATRGQIKEKEEGLFVPFEEEKIAEMKEMLKNLQDSDSFATKKDDWEGARELTKLCPLLGYSCDESPALFMDQSQ